MKRILAILALIASAVALYAAAVAPTADPVHPGNYTNKELLRYIADYTQDGYVLATAPTANPVHPGNLTEKELLRYIADYTQQGGGGGGGGAFDATTVDSVTWSDGTNAENVWTFNLSGTDPAITFSSGAVNVSTGSLQVAGVAVPTISSTSTLTNKTLTAPAYTEVAVAALDIDWSAGSTFTKTLAANSTFTFSNLANGKTVTVAITNTASNYTVTWPTVSWPGGTTPVQTIGAKTDIYSFWRINGVTYGAYVQNY